MITELEPAKDSIRLAKDFVESQTLELFPCADRVKRYYPVTGPKLTFKEIFSRHSDLVRAALRERTESSLEVCNVVLPGLFEVEYDSFMRMFHQCAEFDMDLEDLRGRVNAIKPAEREDFACLEKSLVAYTRRVKAYTQALDIELATLFLAQAQEYYAETIPMDSADAENPENSGDSLSEHINSLAYLLERDCDAVEVINHRIQLILESN